jgi:hypothetical protein
MSGAGRRQIGMRIYEVIVDKKPKTCMLCPIKNSAIKVDMPYCGKWIKEDIGGGWESEHKVPDENCILKERERQF